MNKRTNHVVINEKGEWIVRKAGSSRATKVFDSQKDAINFARKVGKNEQSEVVVHYANGKIRSKNSYEKESTHPER